MKKLLLLSLTALALNAHAKAVKIGYIALPSHAPTVLAYEQGYFQEAGLSEVELVKFQAAQPMAVAIASGDIDYGITAVTGGLLNLAVRSDNIQIIGGALREEADTVGHKIVVSTAKYADINEPKALSGKTFAITTKGSSLEYMGEAMAKAEGIDVQMMTFNTIPAIAAALQKGEVAASSLQPSMADKLIAEGSVKEIKALKSYLPDYQVTVLFTSREKQSALPDEVTAFKQGFAKGVADYQAGYVEKSLNAEQLRALTEKLHRHLYTEQTIDQAESLLSQGAMAFSKDGELNREDVLKQVQWFKDKGLVPADFDGSRLFVSP
ncbi:MAG: ABC transporter substrate-binding protein [Cardiobacteriaceae bacterium]|nr:ABC transporter substrate-binding protein [Cardiobacteriaceae bacterium]